MAQLCLPDQLVAERIAEGGSYNGKAAKDKGIEIKVVDLGQIDPDHPCKNNRREQPDPAGKRPAKQHEDKKTGHNGELPGGRDHPPGREVRTETDQGIKSPETDPAGNDPELPVGPKELHHTIYLFYTAFDQDNQGQKDDHEKISQGG